MATFLQFLNNKALKSTILISGKNDFLVSYSLMYIVDYLRKINGDSIVTECNIQNNSIILSELRSASPYHNSKIVICKNCQRSKNISMLSSYVLNPTERVILILTANSIRNLEGQRWIPTNPNVTYIDCGSLSEVHIVKLIELFGVPEDDSLWLAEHCVYDIGEVLRVMGLLKVFAEIKSGLVRKIADTSIMSSTLSRFYIIDTGNAQSIFRQLRRRLIQLIRISSGLSQNFSIMEISKRAGIEPFMIKRLIPLVRNTQPIYWFHKISSILVLESYADRNLTGVCECIELILNS